ncbi:hypothetical protein AX17_003660 [Amanita inopinata Kibby_2008]|nr:hypothetical protein AX17_003660 [Amanita inopinata Kibby_2008]
MRVPKSRLILFITATVAERVTASTSAPGLYTDTLYMRSHAWPRQLEAPLPAVPTSSSYDYWWPYPSWGASTLTSATLPPLASPTVEQGSLVSLTASDAASSLLSPTSIASPSAPATTSSASAGKSTSTSITASATAPTAIHADPKRTNSQGGIRAPYILFPLLGLFGVVLGGTIAWIISGRCIKRRERRRLIRPYRGSSGYGRGDIEKGWRMTTGRRGSRRWWNTLFSRPEQVEEVIPGPQYVGIDVGEEALEDGGKEVSRVYGLDAEREAMWLPPASRGDITCNSGRAGDQELLLNPQNPTDRRERTESVPAAPTMRPSATSLAVLDLYASDSEDEDSVSLNPKQKEVPWESLRHKSIKRAILARVDEEKKWTDSIRKMRAATLARLKSDTSCDVDGADPASRSKSRVERLQSRVRADSDACVTDIAAAERALLKDDDSRLGVPLDRTSAGGSRSRSRCSTRTNASCVSGGPGFRIVVESPPPQISPSKDKANKMWSFGGFPFFSSREPEYDLSRSQGDGDGDGGGGGELGEAGGVDRYTPVPTRMGQTRSGAKKAKSRGEGSSSAKSPARGTRHTHNDARMGYCALLVKSPTQIMTPRMKSELCFTPILPPRAQLGSDAFGAAGNRSEEWDLFGDGGGGGGGERTWANRPDPNDCSIFTKTYRIRTDRAMKKVEAIVESGWSEREMSERGLQR